MGALVLPFCLRNSINYLVKSLPKTLSFVDYIQTSAFRPKNLGDWLQNLFFGFQIKIINEKSVYTKNL